MSKFRREIFVYSFQLVDVVLLVTSFTAATLPVLFTDGLQSFAAFLALKIKLQNFIAFTVLVWLWRLVFAVLGLYGSKRHASRRAEARDVLKATTICTIILISFSLILSFHMVDAKFVEIFWVTSTILITGTRLTVRTWLRRIRARGQNFRNMLIIGSNARAIEFAKSVPYRPEWGCHILGFADDEWAGVEELHAAGFQRVCDFAGLPGFLRHNVVDEVVIALPVRSFHEHASKIVEMCEEQGIIVRLLSGLFDLKTPRPQEMDDAPVITHYAGPASGWPVIIKRMLDIVLSGTMLIILAPAMLLTAIAIKLTSRGPILFVQKRVGLNKRVFNIYKFRTMVADAEKKLAQIEHLNEVSGPVFKIKSDPRITPLGKFLRKTSIDELPQLLNVLKGDMSLVGPRPLQLRDYELFTEAGPDWQRCRFSVRPGITCLWQVNGRSSIQFEQWMELDQQYVRKWSLWLDMQILMKTIPAVLKGSGAA
ncbi:MAG TPA: sugar transferase [Candidatus Eisenbacteria bacterium]|nr:sugar transferase [Candidatus Eisenbacteria bacterium]